MKPATPIRVEAAIYEQGIETLRLWADMALVRGEWRRAAALTAERHALEREMRRIRKLEGKRP